MNDFDRLLRDSLNSVQQAYSDERQNDRIEARARFIERYRRRRRVFVVGSVALAGAALLAIGAVATGNVHIFAGKPSEVAGHPQEGIVAKIDIGRQPVDVGIGAGTVWAANAGGKSVARVDPATNELLDRVNLDGSPQEVDVGEGAVWVAGFGRVTAIDEETGEIVGEKVIGGRSETISISVGEGAVWAVVGQRSLFRIDPTTLDRREIGAVKQPVDVAARDGVIWVLDKDLGLVRLDPTSGSKVGDPILAQVGEGDISAGQGVVWIADKQGNQVIRANASSGQLGGIYRVEGTYVDMAVTESTVWVLSTRNGQGLLTALDPANGKSLGSPLPLAGDPVEVTVGADGVWVVARGAGAILRVDPASVID